MSLTEKFKESLDSLREEVRELSSQVKSLVPSWKEKSSSSQLTPLSNSAWSWPGWPQVDLAEDDDHFRVRVDLPGLERDDVQLHVESNRLVLSARQEREREEEREGWVMRERVSGSFVRTLPLPAAVQPDSCSAKMKSGVLEIELRKQAPGRVSRRIQVA